MRFWVFFAILSAEAFSQPALSTKSKKAIEWYNQADNYRVRAQYGEAIRLLQQAIAKDPKFAEAHHRLGLVYAAMKQYAQAITAFEEALTLFTDPRKKKETWFNLGEAYLLTGRYADAQVVLREFLQHETQNRTRLDMAALWLQSARYALQDTAASGFEIRPMSDTVNRFPTQYFPVLTADQQALVFTRRLGFGAEHDEDLVISYKDEQGKWGVPQSISANINSPLNEGTCTISADGRRLIFTSCVGRQSYGSCDLYESIKTGDIWSKPRNLGPLVNSPDWESQPSLSADGRTLYFVSDRKGGIGRRDIWVTELGEDGNWTRARNLGKPVNTPYDELSPFIHASHQTLYFASNGHPGYGGFDIFFSEKTSEGWSEPVNLGRPLNDHQDQFALYITPDGMQAYYSREEITPAGPASRIFQVRLPAGKQNRHTSSYVSGTVTDRHTGRPLKARIELIDLNNKERMGLVESDSLTGQYLMVLTRGSDYALYATCPGYLFQSLHFNYEFTEELRPVNRHITLEAIRPGSVTVLQNIFFDVDSYELKEKSITELQKVVRFLAENPSVRIEISGHTDNTGLAAYNQKLSENRALTVRNFLINSGIDPSRIRARGYGAERPVAINDTPEGRQQNRRIEFRILD
jgi:outer membrane protein OmpA-like peptidoglycan-associated protein